MDPSNDTVSGAHREDWAGSSRKVNGPVDIKSCGLKVVVHDAKQLAVIDRSGKLSEEVFSLGQCSSYERHGSVGAPPP
jgi:hypothetical protein